MLQALVGHSAEVHSPVPKGQAFWQVVDTMPALEQEFPCLEVVPHDGFRLASRPPKLPISPPLLVDLRRIQRQHPHRSLPVPFFLTLVSRKGSCPWLASSQSISVSVGLLPRLESIQLFFLAIPRKSLLWQFDFDNLVLLSFHLAALGP